MLETLIELDKDLLVFLNSLHTDWLDVLMYAMSEWKFFWFPFYAFLLGFVIWKQKKKSILTIIGIVLIILWADKFTSDFMKPYFKRPRPSHEESIKDKLHIVNDYRGGSYGFVSSHAANTFALAMFYFLIFRGRWKWLFLWAGVMSYTRIYLGVHYPLDIICGALVGIFGSWVVYQGYKFVDSYKFV